MDVKIGETIRSDDFKTEKHVPVIEVPDAVKKGKKFDVGIFVGKEVPHPNTAEHHIKWVELYAKMDGKPVIQLFHIELGPSYAEPFVKVSIKLEESATLLALSYCNLHGLWESSRFLKVE